MKKIQTQILINAQPEKVWQVLTNFAHYPTWNPFITSIQGEKKVGENIVVAIKPPGSKAMTFKPVIRVYAPQREFRWKGQLGIPGIFDGEHYFILEQVGENKTRFTHGENFSGILVWLMGGMLHKTREGFVRMNEAFKQECEKG